MSIKRKWSEGERVFVKGEANDFPLGNGTVTGDGPIWTYPDHPPRVFYKVKLDRKARRHASDGKKRRKWFVEQSGLAKVRA